MAKFIAGEAPDVERLNQLRRGPRQVVQRHPSGAVSYPETTS